MHKFEKKEDKFGMQAKTFLKS